MCRACAITHVGEAHRGVTSTGRRGQEPSRSLYCGRGAENEKNSISVLIISILIKNCALDHIERHLQSYRVQIKNSSIAVIITKNCLEISLNIKKSIIYLFWKFLPLYKQIFSIECWLKDLEPYFINILSLWYFIWISVHYTTSCHLVLKVHTKACLEVFSA